MEEKEIQISEDAPIKKAKKPKKMRLWLKNRTSENDIKYRGPFSYRTIRIIAWIFMLLAQVGVLMNLAMRIDKTLVASLTLPSLGFSYFSTFPLPLFLLANFAFILQSKNDFKKLLMFYGGVAFLLYVAGVVLFSHFVGGVAYNLLSPNFDFLSFANSSGAFLIKSGNNIFYIFNLFIDLFLCALSYFFLHYNPKKFFQGKKILIFRFLILLPIAYEVASLIIKNCVVSGFFDIPYFAFFLLTAKPPFMFIAFLMIILMMKIQNVGFMRRFKNKEALEDHLQTNAHSLKISLTISWIFLLCALLDLLAFFAYIIFYAMNFDESQIELAALEGIQAANSLGLGDSVCLLLVIPIVLLFSYTRKPKNPTIDRYVPIVAVGLIVLMYVESIYQVAAHKLDMLIEFLQSLFKR